MTGTKCPFPGPRRYRALSTYLQERFGCKVRTVTIDAGFTCPNVDGTVTTGGCIFCDNSSFSPNRRLPRASVTEQIDRGIALLKRRYGSERFLAYFQPGTNTHGRLEKLQRVFDQAVHHPRIDGLIIGTRPDSVPDPVLDLLEQYARSKPVWLELGLQTIHDRSLQWMNRGHDASCFFDAVERCRHRPLELGVHVILGLPGETRADMLATAEALASLPLHSVKIHNLYIVKETPLERLYRQGQVGTLHRDEFVSIVCDFLQRLSPEMVIHRLCGDAPPEFLVAPLWSLDKNAVLQAVDRELLRRQSWQGKDWLARKPEVRQARRKSLPVLEKEISGT